MGKPSIRPARAAGLLGRRIAADPVSQETAICLQERLLHRGEGRYPVWVGVMPEILTSERTQSEGAAKMRGGILHPGLECGSRRGVDPKECGAWIC